MVDWRAKSQEASVIPFPELLLTGAEKMNVPCHYAICHIHLDRLDFCLYEEARDNLDHT